MSVVKENRFLYAIKFIACTLVLFYHAHFPGALGWAVNCIAGFTVPFFFAVSGRYLLVNRDGSVVTSTEDIRKRTLRTLKKLFKITAIVYLIYTVFSLAVFFFYGYSFMDWVTTKYNSYEAFLFFMFNSGRFVYDWTFVFDHMWFLFALIYDYILIFVFAPVLRKWYKPLMVILTGLLLFGELLQTVYPIRPFDISIHSWFILRNWLLLGLPFVLFGIFFGDIVAKRNKPFPLKPSLIVLGVGVVSCIVEYVVMGYKQFFVGSFIIVVAMFLLSETGITDNTFMWKVGKKASGNIYYFHILVIAVLDQLSQNGIIPVFPTWAKPLMAMVVCLILFYVVPTFREKRKAGK